MAEFYIELNPNYNGDHVVHDAGCEHLPSKNALRYSGTICNCMSAVKKAQERFKQVTGRVRCSVTGHAA